MNVKKKIAPASTYRKRKETFTSIEPQKSNQSHGVIRPVEREIPVNFKLKIK